MILNELIQELEQQKCETSTGMVTFILPCNANKMLYLNKLNEEIATAGFIKSRV